MALKKFEYLTINSSLRDLASLLKTERIDVSDLRKGDIVISDHSVQQIYMLGVTGSAIDADGNSVSVPITGKVTILSREAHLR